jgi:hypothetical protein
MRSQTLKLTPIWAVVAYGLPIASALPWLIFLMAWSASLATSSAPVTPAERFYTAGVLMAAPLLLVAAVALAALRRYALSLVATTLAWVVVVGPLPALL